MASGRARCTRKLRNWVVEQVDSGQFSGVCWEDEAKTMFRIPWKHAGKQDFREDQDAAFFKAWAIFKGKYKEGDTEGPAIWKTRLRCALNKSPEFEEVPESGHRDGAEPYKVYRLLPPGTLPAPAGTQKSPSKRHHSSVSPERAEYEGTTKNCILSPSLLQDPLKTVLTQLRPLSKKIRPPWSGCPLQTQTTRCCSRSSTVDTWWVRPRCRAWTAALWLSPRPPSVAWSRWCFPSPARKSPPSAC